MVTIDRNNAHHSERNGRYAVQPKRAGNTAGLGADALEDRSASSASDVSSDLSVVAECYSWEGHRFAPHPEKRDWLCITYDDEGGQRMFSAHKSARLSGRATITGGSTIGARTCVEDGVHLFNVDVGDDVSFQRESYISGHMGSEMDKVRSTIGDGSTIGTDAAIFGESHLGRRNHVHDGAQLDSVTTGEDVSIGPGARVENVHVPDRAWIDGSAAIETPDDMVQLCAGDGDDNGRPVVLLYRSTSPGSSYGTPAPTGRIAVSCSDKHASIGVDELEDARARSDFHSILAGSSGTDAALFDSPDGKHEGIASMLDDPVRIATLAQTARQWNGKQSKAQHL